ncbi:MAG: twin-arginine translocase TatA/TatE family subunit [Anaerolineales bacterium]|nr:twin-arginine translocase TatA/TatE family subunit [Anaerolineales bacterium]
MEIFDIGGPELILVGLLAVFVLGPERLMLTARKAGRVIRETKAYFSSLNDELKVELDMLDDIKDVKQDLEDLKK